LLDARALMGVLQKLWIHPSPGVHFMNRKLLGGVVVTLVLGLAYPAWRLVRSGFEREPYPPEVVQMLPLWEKHVYTDAAGQVLPYRLLKPESYSTHVKYPLVLFLHGATDRGEDNERQLLQGVAVFAQAAVRREYPCWVAAPQCPKDAKWSDEDLPPTPQPTEPTRLALALVTALLRDNNADPQRIYVTGLSMGGSGTWDMLIRRPDLFAAAVPICGGGDETQAAKIAHIPIWAFHGARDTVVQPEHSRTLIEALKKAGGNPKYTEYPEVGHWSWLPAYQEPELFRWLFAQRRD